MPSLTELQLNRQLYKTQPQTVETLDAGDVASNLSPAPSTAIASGNSVTDVNTNAETINGASITPGTIPPETLDVSNWGWTQTSAFTAASATQVNWGAGTFTSANGISYSIGAGNTGTMSAKTFIFLDLSVSSTAYQTTTTSANSVGVGKVLVAIAQNAAVTATFNLNEASQITSDNILANSIDASKIVAGSITATQISASYVYAGTISANSVTAGTLTGSTVQTSSGSDRVVMVASTNDLNIYASNVLRMRLYQAALTFYNSSATSIGSMFADSSDMRISAQQSTANLFLTGGASGSVVVGLNTTPIFFFDSTGFWADTGYDLGAVGSPWRNFNLAGDFNYQLVAQPVTYYGYVNSNGTEGTPFPSGWSSSNDGTGLYTVTHNLDTTSYSVTVSPVGSALKFASIQVRGLDSFQVRVANASVALEDNPFMFILTRTP